MRERTTCRTSAQGSSSTAAAAARSSKRCSRRPERSTRARCSRRRCGIACGRSPGCARIDPMNAVIFDFYGTLAETRDWGPSWDELLAELGYELPAEVRDRWWNDGLDGIEHDEHSRSREHYVAWQQARVRGMLDECGVCTRDQDVLIARVHEISGHRRIDAYDDAVDVLHELRRRGMALAICSNWDWDLHEAIDAAGL